MLFSPCKTHHLKMHFCTLKKKKHPTLKHFGKDERIDNCVPICKLTWKMRSKLVCFDIHTHTHKQIHPTSLERTMLVARLKKSVPHDELYPGFLVFFLHNLSPFSLSKWKKRHPTIKSSTKRAPDFDIDRLIRGDQPEGSRMNTDVTKRAS